MITSLSDLSSTDETLGTVQGKSTWTSHQERNSLSGLEQRNQGEPPQESSFVHYSSVPLYTPKGVPQGQEACEQDLGKGEEASSLRDTTLTLLRNHSRHGESLMGPLSVILENILVE